MKSSLVCFSLAIFILALALPLSAQQGILYGKIYTVDNEELEGFIRWDKNEASWDDILDGNKELDRQHSKKYKSRMRDKYRRDRGRDISVFGIKLYSEGNNYFSWGDDEAQSGIRFGHIKSFIPIGDDRVELELKSGETIELSGGSGDIGDDNREILVDEINEGILELVWDDIDRIDFMPSPNKETAFGKRLYGKVVTRRGSEFTGFICWDKDEAYDEDILDGDEGRRSRKIPFSKIERIERRSSGSAEVTLKGGKMMSLDDSNDIDSGNRGIVISDLNLGSVVVDWDDFDHIEFADPPKGPSYDSFDGGKKLHGTVYTEDGKKYTGNIRWDDDEEYTWEILDGNVRDIEFNIEFAMIASIEKNSHRGSTVIMKDGREFELRDSNDVDDENKGIFIYSDDDKDEVMVDWYDFEKVEFSK
ncbi:MAG: hypothetical protein ABIJ45_14000 [Candidatus Zixiibacteriota bacterium]